jgi:hypothetical protein
MGTNYYLETKPPCTECGRGYERKHIGKSSGGWCFALHVEPDAGINDLDDWRRLWSEPGARIFDEYEREVTLGDMLLTITERVARNDFGAKPYSYPSWKTFHAQNHSQAGPNGLLRHQIGPHCLAHGSGTWDLILGEFS